MNKCYWNMQRRKDETKATLRKRNIRAYKLATQKRYEKAKLKTLIEVGEILFGRFPKGALFCLSENNSLLADFTKCDQKEFEGFMKRTTVQCAGTIITSDQLRDRCSGTFMRN